MLINQPITTLIERRFSCRTYLETPVDPEILARLVEYAAALRQGPLGSATRFEIAAAGKDEPKTLKGLGTYGAIKSLRGFILGALQQAENDLEDYGYLMEQVILFATALNLGTCWLGGTFNRSGFAKKISLRPGESMPAVSSMGIIGIKPGQRVGLISSNAGAANRLPWNQLFFDSFFNNPLAREAAGAYAVPLEMLRLGPSASNKQPWRVVRQDNMFHFYVARTPGYNNRGMNLLNIPDLQRVDIGIAMCHFEMSAAEAGLQGVWEIEPPSIPLPNSLTEYRVSFYAAHS